MCKAWAALTTAFLMAAGCAPAPRSPQAWPLRQQEPAREGEVAPGIAQWNDRDPPVPAIGEDDQAYLLDLAHRTLLRYLKDGGLFEPGERRPALDQVRCRVWLIIRCRGERWADAHVSEGRVSELVRLAVIEAAGSRSFGQRRRRAERSVDGPPGPADWTFVLHVAGPRQFIPAHTVRELERAIVPGIHGIGVRDRRAEAEVDGSEIVARHAAFPDVLEWLDGAVRLRRDPLARNGQGVFFFRFRSLAFGDGPEPGQVVRLIRGARVVDQEEVHTQTLLAALLNGASYLERHQDEGGRLPSSYEPWSGRGTRDAPPHDAALAAWGLARAAGASKHAGLVAAARQALRSIAGGGGNGKSGDSIGEVSPRSGRAPGMLSPDFPLPDLVNDLSGRSLAATAATLAALDDLGPAAQLGEIADWGDTLARTLTAHIGKQDRYEGPFASASAGDAALAIRALADRAARRRDLSALAAAARLWEGYDDAFRKARQPEEAARVVIAAARLDDLDTKPAYAEAALAGADWLAEHQFRPGALEAPYEDCRGGWKDRPGLAGGADTAVLVEALASAYRVARRAGRTAQAERYRRAIAYACRFLLQLQFRPEDTWTAERPEDVLGAFRSSLVDQTLKGDEVGRILLALSAVLNAMPPAEIDRFAVETGEQHKTLGPTSRPQTRRAVPRFPHDRERTPVGDNRWHPGGSP